MGGGRKILYAQFMHSLEIFSIIKSTVAALQSNVRSCGGLRPPRHSTPSKRNPGLGAGLAFSNT